jgi:hypothetical protein
MSCSSCSDSVQEGEQDRHRRYVTVKARFVRVVRGTRLGVPPTSEFSAPRYPPGRLKVLDDGISMNLISSSLMGQNVRNVQGRK